MSLLPREDKDFLQPLTQTVLNVKKKNNKLQFIKTYNLFSSKDIIKKMLNQATYWEEIFAKHICQSLVSKTSREFSQVNNKEASQLF